MTEESCFVQGSSFEESLFYKFRSFHIPVINRKGKSRVAISLIFPCAVYHLWDQPLLSGTWDRISATGSAPGLWDPLQLRGDASELVMQLENDPDGSYSLVSRALEWLMTVFSFVSTWLTEHSPLLLLPERETSEHSWSFPGGVRGEINCTCLRK